MMYGGTIPFVAQGGDLYKIDCAQPRIGEPETYSDLELYLMGLISPQELPTLYVARDPSQHRCDAIIAADAITIDGIVAQYGERSPTYAESPKDFRMATVVYSHERLLTPEEMAWFNHMAQRGEARTPLPFNAGGLTRTTANPFYVATGGRGTMTTRMLP
jgi:hypothetical protein